MGGGGYYGKHLPRKKILNLDIAGCGPAVHHRSAEQDGGGPVSQLQSLRRQGGVHQRLCGYYI